MCDFQSVTLYLSTRDLKIALRRLRKQNPQIEESYSNTCTFDDLFDNEKTLDVTTVLIMSLTDLNEFCLANTCSFGLLC